MFTLPAIGLSSINAPELLIILLIVLVFFGAGKLPICIQAARLGSQGLQRRKKTVPESGVDVTHVASTPKAISSDGLSDAQKSTFLFQSARLKNNGAVTHHMLPVRQTIDAQKV